MLPQDFLLHSAVMRCRHACGGQPLHLGHSCQVARRKLYCPDVQVYAWKQVQDGLRHRAIFSDPSEWPTIKKSRYHGLHDGPFFALHDTLMFLCEGTASFKDMTVRLGSCQVTCASFLCRVQMKGQESLCKGPHRAAPLH